MSKKAAYISVGHGRRSSGVMDPGATTADGRRSEQSEGSPIARACAARLRELGVTVRLNDAGGPDFAGAAAEANRWGADVAVEIHHDWHGAPRGCFGFWYPGSRNGQRLANAIRDALVDELDYPHRAADHRARNLAWCRLTRMPAVLWECDRIGEVRDHAAYGRAMAHGIARYLGVTVTGTSSPSGSSGSRPTSPSTSSAPPFPLPRGHWFGPESPDPRNHSGYWAADRPHVRRIAERLVERGWVRVPVGDRYTTALAERISKFQAEKNLTVDGLTGAETWRALWTAPIT